MKLSEIAKEVGGELRGGDADIRALCTDSRVAGEGELFLCFRGTRTDSHIYAAEAEERGAAAVVCEHETDVNLPMLLVKDGRRAFAEISAAFYGHPERSLTVVGVTGTNGKTTVTHMLYNIWLAEGKNAGLVGTLGARYGKVALGPALTTPDPAFLFSLFADMRAAGVTHVAMEVSAHALALEKECPVFYAATVFTNLTQDHLDFFGDMGSYAAAKRKLFTAREYGFSVLNADDPFTETVRSEKAVTYGLDSPADCFACIEREGAEGTRVLLNLEDELCETTLPMAGRFNVYNALAAATVARRLGASPLAIAEGLSGTVVSGRLERVGVYRGADIFVDFAHTPDGLAKSLAAVREFCGGRLVLVFGCGGNRDRTKRPLMGEAAARGCDFAVITSDNPRYEDPCAIIAEIEAGFRKKGTHYVAIEDREKATAYALNMLQKGDVLLVAGKGGEITQEIMGIKYSYDDKAVIRAKIGVGNA